LDGIDGSNRLSIYSIGQWYDFPVGSEQIGIVRSALSYPTEQSSYRVYIRIAQFRPNKRRRCIQEKQCSIWSAICNYMITRYLSGQDLGERTAAWIPAMGKSACQSGATVLSRYVSNGRPVGIRPNTRIHVFPCPWSWYLEHGKAPPHNETVAQRDHRSPHRPLHSRRPE